MVSFKEVEQEELIEILKEYLDPEYWDSNDFERVIKEAEVSEEWRDVKFEFHQCNIILHTDNLEYKDAEPREGI